LKINREVKSFSFQNLRINLHLEVYNPAEDTFQLLDAINVEKDMNVFEIGTGCGIIALECCRQGCNVICSDINPYAVDLVKKNYNQNKSKLNGGFDIRYGDLFSVLKQNELFDIIIFNPPYLSTKKEELVGGTGWFDVATNGGKDGLKVTERFLLNIKKYLKKAGIGYFVFSSLSKIDKLKSILKKAKLTGEIVNSYNYENERIDIYQIY
jgi:release factor glutamine methyltransferase